MKNRKGMVGLALGIMMILTPGKAFAGEFFSPFTGSDWAGFGLTAIADFADLDSSYSMVTHEMSNYNSGLRAWPTTCPAGLSGTCYNVNRSYPSGEGNPLITGLFGTKYPTALDYTAFGALELLTQSLIALALPERWRGATWGLYVGIGVADTVCNSYSGGVVFRF
jgi:hypothetical protein